MARSRDSTPIPHEDPGLQPERTTLAWSRTMMAFATVSAIFLRWLPHHGPPILIMFAISVAVAGTIHLTQRGRYNTSTQGIIAETVSAETSAVLWTASITAGMSALGIVLVLNG